MIILLIEVRFSIRRLLCNLLPLVFLHRKKVKFYPVFSQNELCVTIAILDAAWMTYNGYIFHNHNKKIKNTALNSIAERQRYPAIMADKQSSFPELNTSLCHILILYGWEEGGGWSCFWYSEPILPIRRIRKLRRAPETPGGPLALKEVFI